MAATDPTELEAAVTMIWAHGTADDVEGRWKSSSYRLIDLLEEIYFTGRTLPFEFVVSCFAEVYQYLWYVSSVFNNAFASLVEHLSITCTDLIITDNGHILVDAYGISRRPESSTRHILTHLADIVLTLSRVVDQTDEHFERLERFTRCLQRLSATRTGNPFAGPEVQTILQMYYDIRGIVWTDGRTDLMRAAEDGSFQLLASLLHQTRVQTRRGDTALILAAKANRISVVQRLAPLESRLRDNSGRTALMHTARADLPLVTRVLIPYELHMRRLGGQTALMSAAETGAVRTVRLLLREVGLQMDDGWTALMLAAYLNKPAVVELLVRYEHGLCSNERSNFGRGFTALMAAAYRGHLACIQLLTCEAGRHMPYSNTKHAGWSALVWAARGCHLDCVQFLLDREPGAVRMALQQLRPCHLNSPVHKLLAIRHSQDLATTGS
ncbi:Ankyrin repeat protein 1 [Giardia muris]|uniref:Ankyrin repeat protein 1 n=1 Tax=Giardia muris TaxID=5742 RepID=A0A4Z1SRL8_GIAMU|nr:Ankyrin repeat protein 1 [Giardia muris]|eukprot:TNJ28380.1 Ankyrin repeat protein 1 [Giardia muris]